MIIRKKRKENRLSVAEVMTVIALVSAPFTALRFSFFGISEIMLIGIILYTFIIWRLRPKIPFDSLSKYFLLFIVTCIVGWIYNFISMTNSGSTYMAVFNLSSYLISAVSMFSLEAIIYHDSIRFQPKIVLERFFQILSVIDILLFAISRTRRTLFGYSLFYYGLFSPLTDNIHQFAMIAVTLPFIGFYIARREQNLRTKTIDYIFSFADLYIVSGLDLTKATLGIVLGCCALIVMIILKSRNISALYKAVFAILLSCGVIIIILFNFQIILDYLIEYFEKNDNHSAREGLYGNGIKVFFNKAFLFGLGPSSHVMRGYEYFDTHETFLTAANSGGIVGLILVITLFWKSMKRTFSNPYLFSAMITILIYALGGDLLRKAAVWVIVTLIVYATA